MAQPGKHPEDVPTGDLATGDVVTEVTEAPREGASGAEAAIIILSVVAVLFWLVLR